MAAASPYGPYLLRTRHGASTRSCAGWMQYYGRILSSAMYQLLSRINAYLVRWIRKKYKRLRAEKCHPPCWRGITATVSSPVCALVGSHGPRLVNRVTRAR